MTDTNILKLNNEIIKVMSRINFIPETVLLQNAQDLHCVVVGKIGREEVLFKSYSKKNKNKSDNLIWEGKIGGLLGKGKGQLFFFKIIDFGSDDKLAWIARKYYQGKTLAEDLSSENIWPFFDRYSVIRPEFLDKAEKYIAMIFADLKSLSQIDEKIFRTKKTKNRFGNLNLELLISQIAGPLVVNLEKTKEQYLKYKSEFEDRKNQRTVSGDLAPTNIFISKQNEIFIYDFEWASLDNYLTDTTFLWLFFWKYPNWQKEIIRHSITSDSDKLHFELNIIRIVLYFYRIIPNLAKKIEKKSELEILNHYKKHIWLKYLIAAGQSFDAIMKIDVN